MQSYIQYIWQIKKFLTKPNLPPKAIKILNKFENIFSTTLPDKLFPPHQLNHVIELVSSSYPIYRLSQPEMVELCKQITKLLQKGFIKLNVLPFEVSVLFVHKKKDTLRLYINYRVLNKLTIKNRYPLLRIENLMDRLAGS